MHIPDSPRRRTLKLELRDFTHTEMLPPIERHDRSRLSHVQPYRSMQRIRYRLLASRDVSDRVDRDLVRADRLEDIRRQIQFPYVVWNDEAFLACLAGGQVLDGECKTEGRCPRELDHTVRTTVVVWGECIVQTVCDPVSVLEPRGRTLQHLLLKQQPLRTRDNRILVLRQRIRGIANLLHLVIDPRGL